MSFKKSSILSIDLRSPWHLLTVGLLINCWYSECTSAAPLPFPDSSKPSVAVVDAVTLKDAEEWIKKYKILSGVRPSAPTPGLEKEIALVQRMAGINVTGELDFETKKLFVIPRCGNTGEAIELSLYGEARQRRRKRDSTDDYLAGACEKLNNYIIKEPSNHFSGDALESIIARQIKIWEKRIPGVAKCRNRRSRNAEKRGEIEISFVQPNSSDQYPFDGKGGTFGEVFFSNDSKIKVYFDDSEPFTTNTSSGMNLDWVALHELGHTLGLKHSNVRYSVMYPWYQGYFPNLELSQSDIDQLQALFGKPSPTSRPPARTKALAFTEVTTSKASAALITDKVTHAVTTAAETEDTTLTVTETPSSSPFVGNICNMHRFDSFMMGADGKTYVFSGDYFWVLSASLSVEDGPLKVTSKWKELETPINSAYTNRDGRMVFFKGGIYWKYYGDILEEGPGDIRQIGLPSSLSDPDAAFVWGGNKKTYFFKGNNYWRYNEFNKAVDKNYPKSIIAWGLPHNMDSVMTWNGNERTYFFKDDEYWRLDDGWLELERGYPRSITPVWMKCETGSP